MGGGEPTHQRKGIGTRSARTWDVSEAGAYKIGTLSVRYRKSTICLVGKMSADARLDENLSPRLETPYNSSIRKG